LKFKGGALIFETIVIGSVAFIMTAFGELPYRDPYAWIAIFLVFYHNQGRAIARSLPEPRPEDSAWYHWFSASIHEIYRDNSRIIEKIGKGKLND
jgi:hypothetical protein